MNRLKYFVNKLITSSPEGLDQLRQVWAVNRQPRATAEVPADLWGGQQGHEKLRGKGGAAHATRVLEGLREGIWLRQHQGESQEAAAREGEEEEEADGRGRGKYGVPTCNCVKNRAVWRYTEECTMSFFHLGHLDFILSPPNNFQNVLLFR